MRPAQPVAAGAVLAVIALLAGCTGSSADSPAAGGSRGQPTPTASSGQATVATPSAQPSPSRSPEPATPTGNVALPAVPGARTLAAAKSHPVEDPYYPATSNPEVDVLHYLLDLTYRDAQLSGIATVTFRAAKPTRSIRLDLADNLKVARVTLDGGDIAFVHADGGLTMQTKPLEPSGIHTATIDYSGSPEPVRAPSKRSDMSEGLGWNTDGDGAVYTTQEPYGAFTWYPSNDHPSDKALYDARITTAAPNSAVFNGTLEGRRVEGDVTTTTWHVDQPMASYLTTIAIGPYEQYTGPTKSGLTIDYWLMKRDKRLLPLLRSEGTAGFDWLVAHAGPYPFASLGVVVVGGPAVMETQTMITINRTQAEIPTTNLQHEMAHQWYGDSVTPTTWQGMWLNEGWAEYMQLWFEADTSPNASAGELSRIRKFDNSARRVAGPPGNYRPDHFGDVNVYIGPALMLDEIRTRVGDPKFEQLVKAWPAQHVNENVDRAEFTRWVSRFTGRDLKPLIDSWLDSPTTPR